MVNTKMYSLELRNKVIDEYAYLEQSVRVGRSNFSKKVAEEFSSAVMAVPTSIFFYSYYSNNQVQQKVLKYGNMNSTLKVSATILDILALASFAPTDNHVSWRESHMSTANRAAEKRGKALEYCNDRRNKSGGVLS
ncbi:hypothetical protein EVAR_59011_1 [Eumeta japonica]|uniref:Uncharacterized protein n=1 Tax=Eumeta variegata TaxID=151549 RepID=A0A4C1ZLI3_EUMVA|nr:hypothetical protein EVAR_59011_1 [Eumeta japonica]